MRRSNVLFEGELNLKPGQEWHSNPFYLEKNSIVRLTLSSDQPHYLGIFPIADYDRLRKEDPNNFPFPFGSDRKEHDLAYISNLDSNHRIVVRLGVFNSDAKSHLRVEAISPAKL